MADFDKAFAATMGHEGGYANHKLDTGGQTYAGISRKNWPKWNGWKYVDTSVAKYNGNAALINADLSKNQTVQVLIKEFYKSNFWYAINAGAINDQQLAHNVFDFAVNAGVGAASKMLQRAANKVCGDLEVDGQVGAKTIAALNKLNGKAVYDNFNSERKVFYDNIIARNPSQDVFRKSWYSRIKPYKEIVA